MNPILEAESLYKRIKQNLYTYKLRHGHYPVAYYISQGVYDKMTKAGLSFSKFRRTASEQQVVRMLGVEIRIK